MTIGITFGKFYPFHLGHNYLIQTAKSQVNFSLTFIIKRARCPHCFEDGLTTKKSFKNQYLMAL
ncbi:adenylyltransferase/cytidyltransferase family protein [Lyngbya sp. PCC 8106]|uniref:adenylyltransferase/cytidyltransferase family protein n=1 Tax=Lyngbya sp. (strain PCC 8106) TaxID=313612 RepID=UPI000904249F